MHINTYQDITDNLRKYKNVYKIHTTILKKELSFIQGKGTKMAASINDERVDLVSFYIIRFGTNRKSSTRFIFLTIFETQNVLTSLLVTSSQCKINNLLGW